MFFADTSISNKGCFLSVHLTHGRHWKDSAGYTRGQRWQTLCVRQCSFFTSQLGWVSSFTSWGENILHSHVALVIDRRLCVSCFKLIVLCFCLFFRFLFLRLFVSHEFLLRLVVGLADCSYLRCCSPLVFFMQSSTPFLCGLNLHRLQVHVCKFALVLYPLSVLASHLELVTLPLQCCSRRREVTLLLFLHYSISVKVWWFQSQASSASSISYLLSNNQAVNQLLFINSLL